MEPADPTTQESQAARPGLRYLLPCLGVVAVLMALDIWSKQAVFALLEGEIELVRDQHGHERLPLVGSWLAFMLNLNYGAAFGQLDGIPTLLVTGRCLAVLLLIWLIFRAPAGHRLYLASLTLILSGALGNLYDNFFCEPGVDQPFGAVRDFIDVYFGIWDWHFPTFNVADSCITVGALTLLLSGLFHTRENEDLESATEPDAVTR